MNTRSGTCLILVLILIFFGCNKSVKQDLPDEKNHPKLIKTIGSPQYGNVRCILQDKNGTLWFGTTENGLYKFDGESFSRYLIADGLNSNNVFTLFEDKDGKIWIGTEVGLCFYDGKTITELKIPLPKNMHQTKNNYFRDKHWVFSIIQTKSGEVWFATIDGVFVYDGKVFTPFILDKKTSDSLKINYTAEKIIEDKDGNIWFGSRTVEGVYRYDGKSIEKFELPELIQNGPKPKPNRWGWPQLQDKNGDIWFTNWGGAYRYNGKLFTSFNFPKNGFTHIIEDRKGNLWFGGEGICRFDGDTFTHLTTKDGLVNSSVWSLLEDKSGNLWIGTRETGLSLYNGKTFITYSEYKQ